MLRLCRLPILAVVVAACASARIGPVTIQTQAPTTICPAARVGGILVADPASGLAFKWSDGSVHGVVWPDGYSARREQDGVVVLIDPAGRIVAREGDEIVSAGAVNDYGITFPCGDLEVHPSSTDAVEVGRSVVNTKRPPSHIAPRASSAAPSDPCHGRQAIRSGGGHRLRLLGVLLPAARPESISSPPITTCWSGRRP